MPYLFFGIRNGMYILNDKILESTSKIARLPMLEMEHVGYNIAQNRYIII